MRKEEWLEKLRISHYHALTFAAANAASLLRPNADMPHLLHKVEEKGHILGRAVVG
jgi:hypothetical protein